MAHIRYSIIGYLDSGSLTQEGLVTESLLLTMLKVKDPVDQVVQVEARKDVNWVSPPVMVRQYEVYGDPKMIIIIPGG